MDARATVASNDTDASLPRRRPLRLAWIDSATALDHALASPAREAWLASLRDGQHADALASALVRVLPWRALERFLRALLSTRASLAESVLRVLDATAQAVDHVDDHGGEDHRGEDHRGEDRPADGRGPPSVAHERPTAAGEGPLQSAVSISTATGEAWRAVLRMALSHTHDARVTPGDSAWAQCVVDAVSDTLAVSSVRVREQLTAAALRLTARAPRYQQVVDALTGMHATRQFVRDDLSAIGARVARAFDPASGLLAPHRAERRTGHSGAEPSTLQAPAPASAAAASAAAAAAAAAASNIALVALLRVVQYGASWERSRRTHAIGNGAERAGPVSTDEWRAAARSMLVDPLLRARLAATQPPHRVAYTLLAATVPPATPADAVRIARFGRMLLAALDAARVHAPAPSMTDRFAQHGATRRATQRLGRLLTDAGAAFVGQGVAAPSLDTIQQWMVRRAIHAAAKGDVRRVIALREQLRTTMQAVLARRAPESPAVPAARDLLHALGTLPVQRSNAAQALRTDDHARRPAHAERAATAPDAPARTLQVDHAGLVLLWPLFSHLFSSLELVREGAFVTSEAAGRAVLLLRMLASGESAAPEPALALERLLCGLPESMPLPRRIAPTEREATRCDQLLAVARERWTPLATTSVEGLRDAFLRRPGRLAPGRDAWTLTVEPRAYDMLLDQLPWMLTPVRLPWMPTLLHVRWRE